MPRPDKRDGDAAPRDDFRDERARRVDGLDLEPVVATLTRPESGVTGLSVGEADQDVGSYRCFLKLCALYPGAILVPTARIDRVWRAHLGDTAKYRADCTRAVGRFVDRFPYYGIRGGLDERWWQDDFARTVLLLGEHFGIDANADAAAHACAVHGDAEACRMGCLAPAAGALRPGPDRGESGVRHDGGNGCGAPDG